MGDQSHFIGIILVLVCLHFVGFCFALPLCTDSRAPFTPRSRVQFCSYNVTTCCNYAEDSKLKKQFDSMNVSDSSCASLLKSVICARCDPFSGEVFRVNDSVPRQVPVLCNSTNNFCSQVWNTCQNVSILNSPFVSPVQGRAGVRTNSNLTKLSDLWVSQTDFCGAFGGSSNDGLACFDGGPVTLNDTGNPIPLSGMCLEKVGNGSYLNMVAHPDGSDRAFFSNQKGKIWLATIPKHGSGGTLELNEANPFLDLTDEVLFDTELGLLGIAFHPKFTENGRFFVSFNCDRSKWSSCAGRCACNSDVGCDPSNLPPDNGAQPCQYQSVIAEFTVNGTSPPASATVANPSEVRRIFTMGLPFTTHHAGQILFGPKDGYLYFMMGDGGGIGDNNSDPYNLAQNKKSLLGKILRLDIDKIPNRSEVGLWGNYSIPDDNPYTADRALQKEIWALGLRNPWRCSFDSARPSYFLCGDVGQNAYEEVDLISKGGNYGWRAYEGPYPYGQSPVGMRSIFPVMGYNHSEVRSSTTRSASITAGYFYRATTNPCLNGRYLFADLFGSAMWAGTENPIDSGKFDTTKINVSCADNSPLRCTNAAGTQVPLLNFIFSFGEDNNKDVFLLADDGVYRIVRPSRCNHTCSSESVLPPPSPPSPTPSPSEAYQLVVVPYHICFLLISFFICAV